MRYSRKYIIQIGICLVLIFIGTYLLIPNEPDFFAQTAQYSFIIDKEGKGDIENILVEHTYDIKKSKFMLYIYPKYPIKDKLSLYLEFPSPLEIIPFPVYKYQRMEFHTWNEGTIGRLYVNILPTTEYRKEYVIALSIPIMKNLSDDWQFCYVNSNQLREINFPISYRFLAPSLSNLSFVGSQPQHIYTGYFWDDIRQGKVNNPTIIKISTAELWKKSQRKAVMGTLFLTLGISYLVNLAYGYFSKQ